MPAGFFENAYFLQSIGWAIVNNLWQAGVLWLIYKAFESNKRLTALVKYYLSLAFLSLSFTWFIFTIAKNYKAFVDTGIGVKGLAIVKLEKFDLAFSFFAVAYFALLLFYIARFLNHYLKMRIVSSKGLQKAPVDIRIFISSTAIHLGIKKKVQVWLSMHVDVPSVTGFIKPIILLPAAMISNLTTEQVNAILLHELSHIKRNDFLVNLIQSILTFVLFFNPFAILLNKAVKKERENCCDDQVLTYRFDKLAYAKALLILEEHRHTEITLALAATDSKNLLSHRIKRLFSTQNPSTSTDLLQKLKLSAFSLLLFIGICLLTPSLKNYSRLQAVEGLDKTWVIPAKIFQENEYPVQEKAPVIIANNPAGSPVTPLVSFKKPAIQNIVMKPKKLAKITVTNKDFTVAMVNDELIHPAPISMVNAVSDKIKDSLQSVFVKIEEQQSGKKQTNTYYFKVNNNNGKTDIQPLVLIKKFKASQNSSNKVSKKAPASTLPPTPKRRVTT